MRWMAHSVWMAMRSIQHPPEAAIPAIGRDEDSILLQQYGAFDDDHDG